MTEYLKCATFLYVSLLFGHNLVKNAHKSDLFRPKILKWFLYKPNQSVLRYLYISRKIPKKGIFGCFLGNFLYFKILVPPLPPNNKIIFFCKILLCWTGRKGGAGGRVSGEISLISLVNRITVLHHKPWATDIQMSIQLIYMHLKKNLLCSLFHPQM